MGSSMRWLFALLCCLRNIYRNPGLMQIDASVLKNSRLRLLGDAGNLQFRFHS